METILNTIVENRKKLLQTEKERTSLEMLRREAEERLGSGEKPGEMPPFFLKNRYTDSPFLIAEIKKASPSKGIIREPFSLEEIARAYEHSPHVSAISVLTEPDFFRGSYENLIGARNYTEKPLLMKDFVIDPYQLYRGSLLGASAYLLIASILTDEEVRTLTELGNDLAMVPLFEAHTEEEYRRALDLGLPIVGINNRDLRTFETSIAVTTDIIDHVGKPEDLFLISESGIHSHDQVDELFSAGVDGFLVGETLMREASIGKAIDSLMEGV